ncbi:MAG: prepilin-type N-terminal cleavage/methylation domain-containing protein [Planctomycetes bacterium]|nr:prepilin-type N-terminal cleavage/methylation domain-containing protein [Planctomycetota bacterium]
MREKIKNTGFSVIEVLMSLAVLTVGMLFVAGVFPVGIHFATISRERTIAAIISDEAFAKIQLYGVDSSMLSADDCKDFNDVSLKAVHSSEFWYPSTSISGNKRYRWSAICRQVDSGSPDLVQVTVFISRKGGGGSKYPDPNGSSGATLSYPSPYKMEVLTSGMGNNELRIKTTGLDEKEKTYINDGSRIVDDDTGAIYRVGERYVEDDDIILLDRDWSGGGDVWVIPPPKGGGRYPCIAVYQRIIKF